MVTLKNALLCRFNPSYITYNQKTVGRKCVLDSEEEHAVHDTKVTTKTVLNLLLKGHEEILIF